MPNKERHRRRSLCDKSMDLIVSIIKVSSLSLASKSFRTRATRPPAKRYRQLPGGQTLPEPASTGSKYPSYAGLIEIERESPEIGNVDDRASNYIKGFHAKNSHHSTVVTYMASTTSFL